MKKKKDLCRWCGKPTSSKEIKEVGGFPCHYKCRVRQVKFKL